MGGCARSWLELRLAWTADRAPFRSLPYISMHLLMRSQARALSGAHLQAVAAGGAAAARAERRWFSSQVGCSRYGCCITVHASFAVVESLQAARCFPPVSCRRSGLQAAPVEVNEAAAPRASSSSSSAPAATLEPAAAAAPLPQPTSSAAADAVAAAARDAHLRAAVAGFTDAVSSAGMSLAAALMQKQHRGKPPGIAELAVEVLEVRGDCAAIGRGGVGSKQWAGAAWQQILSSADACPSVFLISSICRHAACPAEDAAGGDGRGGAAGLAAEQPAVAAGAAARAARHAAGGAQLGGQGSC